MITDVVGEPGFARELSLSLFQKAGSLDWHWKITNQCFKIVAESKGAWTDRRAAAKEMLEVLVGIYNETDTFTAKRVAHRESEKEFRTPLRPKRTTGVIHDDWGQS